MPKAEKRYKLLSIKRFLLTVYGKKPESPMLCTGMYGRASSLMMIPILHNIFNLLQVHSRLLQSVSAHE